MKMLAPLLISLASPAAAQTPPDEASQVAQAVDRGRLIFAYDRAAWIGTDAMRDALPAASKSVGGYIVDGPMEAPQLIFFDTSATKPVYVARFKAGKLIDGSVVAGAAVLTPEQKALIAARQTALQAFGKAEKAGACSDASFNTVVLPPIAPGAATSVYLLTPQTRNDTLPIGGHYRIDVGADGRAGPVRRFANSCLTVVREAPGESRQAVAAFVTHLLDQTPTEIHVFTSLALGKPLFVGTMRPTRRLWSVSGGRIGAPQAIPDK